MNLEAEDSLLAFLDDGRELEEVAAENELDAAEGLARLLPHHSRYLPRQPVKGRARKQAKGWSPDRVW